MKIIETEIKITTECATCGQNLDKQTYVVDKNLFIEPCPFCIENARKKGIQIGKGMKK